MYSWERKGEYHMTVEELVKILDKEVTFEVLQAYDREIIFESSNFSDKDNNKKWQEVKDRIVYEFYPTDTRELFIFVYPTFMENK